MTTYRGSITPGAGSLVALTAADISVTATGNITSTTVQDALRELDDEKQPLDAGLTSISGLTTSADKMIYTTALDTYAVTDLTSFARSILDDASEADFKATVNLEIGTDVQAYDATLASLSALGTAADKYAYTTGVDTWAEGDITAAGRAILDDVDASAQRTTLGLGSSAVEDIGSTIGDVVQLENVGGSAGLPAVDGSQLTGITASVSVIQSPVRQTVLTGPVDSDGRADFLAAGTGLEAVTSGLATDNLIATWGDGFGDDGKVDYLARLTSDLSFSGLTDDDTNYLYLDLDPSDGSVTEGSTILAPEYSYAKPSSPSTNQYWYPVDHRSRGEYWDSAAWQPVYRLFIGEAVTSGGSVASVVSYAYQGKYISDVFSITTSSQYIKSHSIGTDVISFAVFARKDSDYNWARMDGGHTNQASSNAATERSGLSAANNADAVVVGTPGSLILVGSDASYGMAPNRANATDTTNITIADCLVIAERGF